MKIFKDAIEVEDNFINMNEYIIKKYFFSIDDGEDTNYIVKQDVFNVDPDNVLYWVWRYSHTKICPNELVAGKIEKRFLWFLLPKKYQYKTTIICARCEKKLNKKQQTEHICKDIEEIFKEKEKFNGRKDS
jgi:hypothetical protein